jgi:hypothetical protein
MSGFDAARRAALITDLLAAIAGRPADLLPFDDVRREFHFRHLIDRGIQEAPLDRIVSSFNRASELNRLFLLRRWEEIIELAEGQRGSPRRALPSRSDLLRRRRPSPRFRDPCPGRAGGLVRLSPGHCRICWKISCERSRRPAEEGQRKAV